MGVLCGADPLAIESLVSLRRSPLQVRVDSCRLPISIELCPFLPSFPMFYGEPGTLPRPTGCQLPHAVVPHREFHLLRSLRAALLPPSPKGRLPSSASWRIPGRSRTSIGSTDRPRSVVREPRSDGPLRYAVDAARRMRVPHELGAGAGGCCPCEDMLVRGDFGSRRARRLGVSRRQASCSGRNM